MSSLPLKVNYLNWILGTVTGISLWIRNEGLDRTVGTALIIFSLVFLMEYGIANQGKSEDFEKFIGVVLGLTLLLPSIVGYLQGQLPLIVTILGIITGLMVVYTAFTSPLTSTPYFLLGAGLILFLLTFQRLSIGTVFFLLVFLLGTVAIMTLSSPATSIWLEMTFILVLLMSTWFIPYFTLPTQNFVGKNWEGLEELMT
jgi:hypothetical protein